MTEPTTLEEVAAEVSALRDLFQRRLLEDKAKNRLYEELFAQSAFVREELARAYLRPIYSELLLIIDRLSSLIDDPVASSTIEEILEVLHRRGVRSITEVETFDPRLHEAVRTEPSDEVARGGIVARLRDGYTVGGEVLRPAAVVVSEGPRSISEVADSESSDSGPTGMHP